MVNITEKVELNKLAQVKGIGKKTLERIKQELLSEKDENTKYELEVDKLPLNEIFNIECKEGMQRYILDESLDAIICDPPYNLSFMDMAWDSIGTPQQFQEWNKEWAEIAYKKLKPGGYMLVFGGTRTYHRMVSGVEDAGFEVKDMIEWCYGTGMPKSRNIWKYDIKPKTEEQLREQGVDGDIDWKEN